MFEKISKDVWEKFFKENVSDSDEYINGINSYDSIVLPERKTIGSAGYDFIAPMEIRLPAKVTNIIPTGIKVNLNEFEENVFLALYPRSSLGFKYGFKLSNTVGIIDKDYYNNESNEGHILLAVTVEVPTIIEKGSGICQGIIQPFLTFKNEKNVTTARTGGIGSTNK